MSKRSNILFGMMIFGLSSLPVQAATTEIRESCSASMVVNAPLQTVWDALRTERTNDPKHRRVISASGGDFVVEETFEHLPVVGDAVCTYKEHEIPMSKLQYQMISSDKLKTFEGVWELSPAGNNQTNLKLSSRTDTGIDMPFSRNITRNATIKYISKKLADIQNIVSTQKVASIAGCR